MAHFAKIENGIVTDVIVAEQDFIDTLPDNETWIQTSYNTVGGVHVDPETGEPDGGVALRGNYAGIGHIYDSENDVFYRQQPYPSWTLDETTWTWQSPIGNFPDDGNVYEWSEEAYNEDNTTGWIIVHGNH